MHHTANAALLSITNMKTNITLTIIAVALMAVAVSSCSDKKKTNEIITHKPVAKKPTAPTAMQEYSHQEKVEWLGNTYTVSIKRQTDKELGVITDEAGGKYYENRITLRIMRGDGSVFFDKTFSKADFGAFIDKAYMEKSALLGIVLDKADGDNLRFAASIGAPDVLSDEYVPLALTVSRTGNVSISKDARIEAQDDVPEDEYEGV